MTDLSILQGEEDQKLGLLDSDEQPQEREPTVSDKAVAAQAALLSSDEDDVASYLNITRSSRGQAQEVSDITEGAYEQENRELQETAAALLLDPSVESIQAERMIQAVADSPRQKAGSDDLLIKKMASEYAGEESPVEENFRLDAAKFSQELIEARREKQAIINSVELFGDPTKEGAELLLDVADSLTPVSQQDLLADFQASMQEGEWKGIFSSYILPGEVMADWREIYLGLETMDDRLSFLRRAALAANAADTLVATNDNNLMQRDLINSIAVDGYYTDFDQFIDNLGGVLESTGILYLLGKGIKSLSRSSRLASIEDLAPDLDGAKQRATVGGTKPSSVLSLVSEANPEKAKDLQVVVDSDLTGEAAQALTGTSRDQAVVEPAIPQPKNDKGKIQDRPYAVDSKIKAILREQGNLSYSDTEIAKTQSEVITRLEAVNNVVLHDSKTIVEERAENGNVRYGAVYSPAGGRGWTDPNHALEMAKWNFRDYDIEDKDFVLVYRLGDEFVETTPEEVLGKTELAKELKQQGKQVPNALSEYALPTEFMVKVNLEYELNPSDVVFDENVAVKRNIFDSASALNKLKVNRSLIPIAASLDPRLVRGAEIGVDNANALNKVLNKYAEKFFEPASKLDKKSQTALWETLEEQNTIGKKFDKATLRRKGFKTEEMELFDVWEDIHNQLHYLEDRDLKQTLVATNHKLYIDPSNGDEWVTRPISKMQVSRENNSKGVGEVYDPAIKNFRKLSPEELKDLYDGGGTIAKLKVPEVRAGRDVEYVKVVNVKGSPYVRAIKDSDSILRRREGYYTIRHKDPYFLYSTDLDGKTSIVGTAANRADAELARRNLNDNAGQGESYDFRPNRDLTTNQRADAEFALAVSSGRTAQRKRGDPLTRFGANGASEKVTLQTPVESLNQSISSISQRVGLRPVIEGYAARIISQYGKVLPKDKHNQPYIPVKSDEISVEGDADSRTARDARTTVEHYNSLVDGYFNSLDEGWKWMFNSLGELAGKAAANMSKGKGDSKLKKGAAKAATGVESALRIVPEAVPSPVGLARKAAFDAYIVFSMPMTQWVVQGHTSLAVSLVFPKHIKGIAADSYKLMLSYAPEAIKAQHSKDMVKEAEQLRAEWDKTGFMEGIDRHNMVENALDELIQSSKLGPLADGYDKLSTAFRRVGFDAGEFVLLSTYWLGNRRQALADNKNVTNPRYRDEIRAKTRAMTQHMNRAADVPWQKNSASMLMQFMQHPYKSLFTFLDRGLTYRERLALQSWYVAAVPLPAALTWSAMEALEIEDETAKELVYNGVLVAVFNALMSATFDEKTSISGQRLSVTDPALMTTFIHGLLTNDPYEIIKGTPAGSLFLGENAPVSALFSELKNLVSGFVEGEESDEQVLKTLEAFTNLTSLTRNFSNEFKQRFIEKYENRYNALGYPVVENISSVESVLRFGGWKTTREDVQRVASQKLREEDESRIEDVEVWFREASKLATLNGFNLKDPRRPEYIFNKVFQEVNGDWTQAQKDHLDKLVRRQQKSSGDIFIYSQVANQVRFGQKTPAKAEAILKSLPGSEDSARVQGLLEYLQTEQAVNDLIGGNDAR